MKLLLLQLLLLTHSVSAPDYCNIPESGLELSRLKIDGRFSFFRPFSERYVGDGTNYYDLETGKAVSKKMIRRADLFPTPDDKFLTAPGFVMMALGGSPPQLIKGDRFSDPELSGVYQSVGILKMDEKSTTYRAFVTSRYRDYQVIERSPNRHEFKKLGPIREFRPDRSLSLSYLSKDGREVSGSTLENPPYSRIYRLAEAGGAELVDTIKSIDAGKADFSFDGERLTYASIYAFDGRRVLDDRARFMSQVFVYDRKKRSSRVVSNGKGSAYFPSFLKDGTLIYFRNGELIHVDPNPSLEKIQKKTDPALWNGRHALAKAWSSQCGGNIEDALLAVTQLTRPECEAMENSPFCKTLPEPEIESTTRLSQIQKVDPRIPSSCITCHSLAQLPLHSLTELKKRKPISSDSSSRTLLEETIKRMRDRGPMGMPPPGMAIADRERDSLLNYLEGN